MEETVSNLKMAWPFLKEQKKKIIAYAIVNLFNIVISLILPLLSAKIIVNLTSNQLEQVIYMGLVILFIELLTNVLRFLSQTFAQGIYRESFKKLLINLGENILKIENKILDNTSSGVFIERLNGDASKIADIFFVLYNNLGNIITDIGIFGAIFIINKYIFLYVLICVFIVYIFDKRRIDLRTKNEKEHKVKREKGYGFVCELVRGTRDIKMLNCEKSFINELRGKVEDINSHRYKMDKTNRNYNLFISSLHDLIEFELIFLLVYFIGSKKIEVAYALALYNYSGRVSSIIYYFSSFIESIKSFNLSSSRVFAILNDNEYKKEVFGDKRLDKINGDFEFKNVSFSYKEKKVLDNINFKILANTTTAIVGKSGSGKTTIFNLLCKMYNIDSGEITIDGININNLDKDSIRGNITIISQNPYIFNLSIKDNLKLVKKDITMKEIKNACKMACLDEFIDSLPDKYDTVVGEGGVTLSGGERQRLAIARAFIQKTEIILFDEATSALDNETQNKIKMAIDNLKKDYTIIIIAHRLSTIINSDKILFLNNGKIEREGTHEELLNSYKPYRNLYDAEIKK